MTTIVGAGSYRQGNWEKRDCALTAEDQLFILLQAALHLSAECPRVDQSSRADDRELCGIDHGVFRKWLRRLPHPFSGKDRQAGYRYDLSILQAEFSLTQIWDRAVSGRCYFEEIIRENIDLGRPEQVQLIFSRKLKKSTVAEPMPHTHHY